MSKNGMPPDDPYQKIPSSSELLKVVKQTKERQAFEIFLDTQWNLDELKKYLPNLPEEQISKISYNPQSKNFDITIGSRQIEFSYEQLRKAMEKNLAANLTADDLKQIIAPKDENFLPQKIRIRFDGEKFQAKVTSTAGATKRIPLERLSRQQIKAATIEEKLRDLTPKQLQILLKDEQVTGIRSVVFNHHYKRYEIHADSPQNDISIYLSSDAKADKLIKKSEAVRKPTAYKREQYVALPINSSVKIEASSVIAPSPSKGASVKLPPPMPANLAKDSPITAAVVLPPPPSPQPRSEAGVGATSKTGGTENPPPKPPLRNKARYTSLSPEEVQQSAPYAQKSQPQTPQQGGSSSIKLGDYLPGGYGTSMEPSPTALAAHDLPDVPVRTLDLASQLPDVPGSLTSTAEYNVPNMGAPTQAQYDHLSAGKKLVIETVDDTDLKPIQNDIKKLNPQILSSMLISKGYVPNTGYSEVDPKTVSIKFLKDSNQLILTANFKTEDSSAYVSKNVAIGAERYYEFKADVRTALTGQRAPKPEISSTVKSSSQTASTSTSSPAKAVEEGRPYNAPYPAAMQTTQRRLTAAERATAVLAEQKSKEDGPLPKQLSKYMVLEKLARENVKTNLNLIKAIFGEEKGPLVLKRGVIVNYNSQKGTFTFTGKTSTLTTKSITMKQDDFEKLFEQKGFKVGGYQSTVGLSTSSPYVQSSIQSFSQLDSSIEPELATGMPAYAQRPQASELVQTDKTEIKLTYSSDPIGFLKMLDTRISEIDPNKFKEVFAFYKTPISDGDYKWISATSVGSPVDTFYHRDKATGNVDKIHIHFNMEDKLGKRVTQKLEFELKSEGELYRFVAFVNSLTRPAAQQLSDTATSTSSLPANRAAIVAPALALATQQQHASAAFRATPDPRPGDGPIAKDGTKPKF